MFKERINICTDPILRELLHEEGIEATVFDSILCEEEKIKMLEALDRFASGWFLDRNGDDYTDYRNVSIGAAIYDEVRLLFTLLFHFVYWTDKLTDEFDITFYQSKSCMLPDHIIELLRLKEIPVMTMEYSYPFFCYKKRNQQYTHSNYIFMSFGFLSHKGISLRQIYSDLKELFLSFFTGVIAKSLSLKKHYLYVHGNRSLKPFYLSFVKKNNESGLFVSNHTDITNFMKDGTLKSKKKFLTLIRLSLRGIIRDSLSIPFYFRLLNRQNSKSNELRTFFLTHYSDRNFDGIRNKNGISFINEKFKEMYVNHIEDFILLIDFYYNKLSNRRIISCLQEFVNSFQAQVMASLKKKIFLFPVNYVTHNQYFTLYLLNKTSKYFKVLSVSEYDASRYQQMGFSPEDIGLVNPTYFRDWRLKLREPVLLKELNGKRVLVLPPTGNLDTFRAQISSESLISYLTTTLDVLKEIGVKSVTIRCHPGAGYINDFKYTQEDFFRYSIKFPKEKMWTADVIFSDNCSVNSLEKDILNNDIVIGSMSQSILYVLLLGRDYILFDNYISPNIGKTDRSVFDDGTILKRLRTEEQLREALLNYKGIDRRQFFQRYFKSWNIFDSLPKDDQVNYNSNRYVNIESANIEWTT